MRPAILLILGTLLLSSFARAEIGIINRVELESPESAYYDENPSPGKAGAGVVFVSSMGNSGDALIKNGTGTISVLNSEGSLLQKDWFKAEPAKAQLGLNSPKGLFAFARRLLVAEKDSIRVIEYQYNPSGGAPFITDSFQLPIQNAQLLNDIVVISPGVVFVTDTFGNRIYRITGLFLGHDRGQPPPWAKFNAQGIFITQGVAIEEFVSGLHLLSPNGITYDPTRGKLWVVGTDTFTGYGNFTTPIRNDRGGVIVEPNLDMPLPKLHPSISPGINPFARTTSFPEGKKLEAADALNPTFFPDAKRTNPLDRLINPVNSLFKAHHAKIYSVDLESREITILPSPDGGFDGVAVDEAGHILVGDFGAGKILDVQPMPRHQPSVTELLSVEHSLSCADPTFCSNPADFSLNLRNPKARRIYVPNLSGGEVQTYSLGDPQRR